MSLHLSDPIVHKLVRMIMKHGKKHAALKIVDDAFHILRSKHNVGSPIALFHRAVANAAPVVETRGYKASGRTVHVPLPCGPKRSQSLAMRFIRDAFRERKENGGGLKLANELFALEKRQGGAYSRREEMHKRAEANRAFAHFAR
ncbi:30S ribosomal protein S7 [Gracilariopsis chorda]|uniref:30S ribosomal protein S7 n=1 Tax=Gracilariopsis chorda TaxID=448386 RepID=A0A2V3IIS8_9FLOR|nr:30S ribosomal protein S7 [Gracilariopsis chorda]|eukprot:PXF41996.1 30S ribosomal protein S7 [Gracilariopsis chorda]